MNYGLFLYADLGFGERIEIHKKDYTGPVKRIVKMGSPAYTFKPLDNDSAEVSDTRIVKSTLEFSIIDMGELDYSIFYTDDAKLWRVVLIYDGIQEWSGYITPESYMTDCSYRNSVSLTARDNLGELEQIEYEWLEYDFVSIRQLILKACDLVGWNFRPIEYKIGLVSSNGTVIEDSVINIESFKGKTWWEIITDILTSISGQLVFVGENRWMIENISDMALRPIIDISDRRTLDSAASIEVIPTWRKLNVRQDYQPVEKISAGKPLAKDLDTLRVITQGVLEVQTYKVSRGKFQSRADYPLPIIDNSIIDNHSKASIIAIADNREQLFAYVSRKWKVSKSNNPIKLSITVKNHLYQWIGRQRTDFGWKYQLSIGPTENDYSWTVTFSIHIVTENGDFLWLHNDGFKKANETSSYLIKFKIDTPKFYEFADAQPPVLEDKVFNIIANEIPTNGTLYLDIYRTEGEDLRSDNFAGKYPHVVIYEDIQLSFEGDVKSGIDSDVAINPDARTKQELKLLYGEVPQYSNQLLYLGGLYEGVEYVKPLIGWHRADDVGGIIPLSEIMGRAYAHNFNGFILASGESSGGELIRGKFEWSGLSVGNTLRRGEKLYAIYSATIHQGRREADLTLRQVLHYEHRNYELTNAPIDAGGGSSIGGGSNMQLGWTSQAGNSKRIYELSETEHTEGYYVVADKAGNSEAQKVNVKAFATNKHASTHACGGTDEVTSKSIEAISAKNLKVENPIHCKLSTNNELTLSHTKSPRTIDLNRYGNVTDEGHVLHDYHPDGGRLDRDFTAEEIQILKRLFSKDYTPGHTGFAFTKDEWGRWLLEVDRIVARESLTVPEFIKNRVTVANNQTWFTDNGIIETVAEVEGNHAQRIITIAQQRGGACTFLLDDLIKGIYLDEIDGRLDFQTVRMTVLELVTPYTLRVSVDQGTPPPRDELIVVRTGNRTNVDRQNSIFIDGARPAMFYYVNVDSHTIGVDNIAQATGNLKGFNFGDLTGNEPIKERFSNVIRGSNYQEGHFVQKSGNGLGYPVPADRGAWIEIPAVGGVRRCYHYDRVSHNGSIWDCAVKETVAEPSEQTPDWTKRIAKGQDGNSVFITYHDNSTTAKPAKPTGNGTTGGWHTAPSSSCVWMSQKVARTASAGEWTEPIQIQGDGVGSLKIGNGNLLLKTTTTINTSIPWTAYSLSKRLVPGRTYIFNATVTGITPTIVVSDWAWKRAQRIEINKPFIAQSDNVYVCFNNDFSPGSVYDISNAQLEEGNIATAWAPCVADYEESEENLVINSKIPRAINTSNRWVHIPLDSSKLIVGNWYVFTMDISGILPSAIGLTNWAWNGFRWIEPNKPFKLEASALYLAFNNDNNNAVATMKNFQLMKGTVIKAWRPNAKDLYTPLSQGVFQAGKVYYYNNNRQDVVKYGGAWHRYIGIDGQVQSAWNADCWEPFGASFESVATGLLLAEEAFFELGTTNEIRVCKADGTVTAGMTGKGGTAESVRIWAGGNTPTGANSQIRESGSARFGELDIAANGAVTIHDNGRPIVLFSTTDISTLSDMLSANVLRDTGVMQPTYEYLTDNLEKTYTMPATLSATPGSGQLSIRGKITGHCYVNAPNTNTGILIEASVTLLRNGAYYMNLGQLVTKVGVSYSAEREQKNEYDFSTNLSGVPAGTYSIQVRRKRTASGSAIGGVYHGIEGARLGYNFAPTDNQTQLGRGLAYIHNARNHVYFGSPTRNTNFVVIKADKSDIPGVLASCSVSQNGGISNAFGAKVETRSASKVGTGKYIVHHNIGHDEYTVQATGNTTRTDITPIIRIWSKNSYSVEVHIYQLNASMQDCGFDITMIGNNQPPLA